MDFFSQQDKARRNTGLLVFLFLSAVFTLIAITNLMVMVAVMGVDQSGLSGIFNQGWQGIVAYFNWQQFFFIGAFVCSAVVIAIVYKWSQLASGGKGVAEAMGGQRIHPSTEDLDQKRILNVVEEMAIAAGMPVPPVYLLAHEPGINAFAAGNTPADAVIGVTQGSLERFDRDQLQGVIAHEFSHILNGDMRLNLRLIAMLHGIVFIGYVGEMLLRGGRYSAYSSRRNKNAGGIMALGLGLLVVGWMGRLFGSVIKSAVSRQREFLADASAVQFTRNPQGISDALKVIGGHTYGTQIETGASDEISHMFFGQCARSLSGLFSTHPPLMDRILRIEPNWDGAYISPRPSHLEQQKRREEELAQAAEKARKKEAVKAAVIGAVVTGQVLDADLLSGDANQVREGLDHIPDSLAEYTREPLSAMALVFALLIDTDEQVLSKQQAYLVQQKTPGLLTAIEKVTGELALVHRALHLQLLEMAMPALKTLSQPQYITFKQRLLLLIRADDKTDLYEWCLYQLLVHYLEGEFENRKVTKPQYKQPQEVSEAMQLVLSVLVHHGHTDPDDAERAFNKGAGSAGLYNIRLLAESDCDLDAFRKAVGELAKAYPLLKSRILRGLENCIKQDGDINYIEREIVSSIAAVMDVPIPNFVRLGVENVDQK